MTETPAAPLEDATRDAIGHKAGAAPARRLEDLPPAARRALEEAAERRRRADAERAAEGPTPREIRGRDGPEPVRYGDWELKGLASDF